MEPELRQLLQNTFNLAEENNRMLRKIRRSQKIADFMRFMYWVIIIGIAIGAFYFLQPYVEQVRDFAEKAGVGINSLQNILPK